MSTNKVKSCIVYIPFPSLFGEGEIHYVDSENEFSH